MLFAKKQPRRLTAIEVDEIRKRVQTFHSRLLEGSVRLTEAFAIVENDGSSRN